MSGVLYLITFLFGVIVGAGVTMIRFSDVDPPPNYETPPPKLKTTKSE